MLSSLGKFPEIYDTFQERGLQDGSIIPLSLCDLQSGDLQCGDLLKIVLVPRITR